MDIAATAAVQTMAKWCPSQRFAGIARLLLSFGKEL